MKVGSKRVMLYALGMAVAYFVGNSLYMARRPGPERSRNP